ncbi:MAG: zinc-dependent metalloprotease, partial [Pyrinomonadaceae bacterium]
PADKQRDALKAILETIDPKELAIPENVLSLIPPTAYGYGSGRSELFQKRTSPMFDPVGAAEIAADVAISVLLEPNRAARTISQNARNKQNPHFREVVTELVKTAWKAAPADANQVVIQRAVQSIVVSRLMDLAANERAQSQVKAVASDTLRSLLATLKKGVAIGEAAAFNRALVDDLTRFIERPDAPRKQTAPLATPPGDPIGN